jgi:ATP-dependent helicase HrpA
LRDLERYLRGILVRCERAPSQVSRDASLMDTVARVQAEFDTLIAALPVARRSGPDVQELRWMLEELRVSLFAQTLGTAHPVSEKRIYKAMDQVEALA